MWYIWLIAAGIFLIAEIITIGFLIFWLSIGALIAMVVSFFTANIFIQMTVFVISSSILIFATRKLSIKISKPRVPTNIDSLVDKEGIVIKDIDSLNGSGQIKIAGELWSAKSETNEIISKGTEVKVIHVDGVKAIVEPIRIISTLDK